MWIYLEETTLVEAIKALASTHSHLANEFQAKLDLQNEVDPATQAAYLTAAKRLYEREGELEFDEGAVVSLGGDPGAYVMGWRWIREDEAGLGEEDDA